MVVKGKMCKTKKEVSADDALRPASEEPRRGGLALGK